MRVLVVLALLMLPTAQAVVAVDDPSGDVTLNVMDTPTTSLPAGVRDGVDIVGVGFEETEEDILVILSVASLEDMFSPYLEDKQMHVYFHHGGIDYRIRFGALLPGDEYAFLDSRVPGEQSYDFGGDIDLQLDAENDAVVFTIDRYDIPDANGAPATKGATFTDVAATGQAPVTVSIFSTAIFGSIVAQVATGQPYVWILSDEAGMDAPGTYAVQMGLEQTGDGRLRADEAYRTSNGEAGTFVYWVDAGHNGTGVGRYTFSISDVPSGWAVQYPQGEIELGAQDTLRVPVIVQTAFAHQHGATEEFTLAMEGGGGKAQMRIGIRYPEVPQPSGHHDTLYLRSHQTDYVIDQELDPVHETLYDNPYAVEAYMNAADSDDTDLGAAVDFVSCGNSILGSATATSRYCMEIPLSPTLQMGIDMRQEDGVLVLPLDTSRPVAWDGTLDGHIEHYTFEVVEPPCPGCFVPTQEEVNILATIEPQEVTLDSSSTDFEFVVKPTAYADYVPYDPTGGMRMVLNFTTSDPVSMVNAVFNAGMHPAPRLQPGGYMQLPFDEYKDTIEDIPSFGQDLVWTVNATQRLANPGDVLLYRASLTNEGKAGDFSLRIVGNNREWAELGVDDVVKLGANKTVEVPVIVRVPEDASLDATADLVVEAASTTDVGRRSIIQLRTLLTDDEVPDDLQAVDGLPSPDKKSPSIGIVLLAAGLLAMARRR